MRGLCCLAFLFLLLVPTGLPGQAVRATPGKVTKQYQEGDVGFRYPENWTIRDRKGSGIVIGEPSFEWTDKKKEHHFYFPDHGLLFGSYDGNATNLEDAASEIEGVVREPSPDAGGSKSFYLTGRKTVTLNGRDFVLRACSSGDLGRGFLLVTRYNNVTWYWLLFYPLLDASVYLPTAKAIIDSITIPPPEGSGPRAKESPEKAGHIPTVSRLADLSGQEVAKRCFPSVVMLVTRDAKNHLLALGSGFIVDNDVIATNLHVWTGAAKGVASFIGSDLEYPVKGIVAKDVEHDLVLLRIAASNAPTLPLGNSATLSIGEKVYSVGNPEGLEGTFSEGIVSSVRNFDSGSLVQITAPISAGSSGGPVLNARGEVIGIATATLKEGQNLNFAIPSAYLQALLRRAGIGVAEPLD